MTTTRKKLIEVALPLEAINKASAREKSIRHGHPSTLHLWWARRPLAAARAVIFAQMVDDPSAWPDLFPTEEAQEAERQRLFRIIEDLVLWENTTNETVLERARAEIRASWRRACADNADHPRAGELFDPDRLPGFHDPFAGGGALPLEAQRLGLEAHASDLNPVAVLINKAMIEIPPKFAGLPPVNPEARAKLAKGGTWNGKGAEGLAEDVRYYGKWMCDEAEKRIGHLYPKVEITAEMAVDRPDLEPLVGQKLTVIAWLWARTVKCPNPAFRDVDVPLVSSFMLSTKPAKETWVEPVIENDGYRFVVRVGKPTDLEAAKNGTKLGRGANFRCVMSSSPITPDYIKEQARAGRMSARMMAVAVEGKRGRIYLNPTNEMEIAANNATPEWRPELMISGTSQYLGVKPYGIERFDQIFSPRQLVSLSTVSGLVKEARENIKIDSTEVIASNNFPSLVDGGDGAMAYADAVAVYLGFIVGKLTESHSTICTWSSAPKNELVVSTFRRQAIPMTWDYAESNPFADSSGSVQKIVESTARVISTAFNEKCTGSSCQADASSQRITLDKVVSTDPPYYDNVPYADLSDYFYVWLRRTLRDIFPDNFSTLTVPKREELVAFAYRHDQGKAGAEAFFLSGMTSAMNRLKEQSHPAFPITIYYAFKQSEMDSDEGVASTGWETFLEAIIRSGFVITGTWPTRTERDARSRAIQSNALASSIVLVSRQRPDDAPAATKREFLTALKNELPAALVHLQRGNIAPVDLAQSAIGPGMAVYTRYARVLDAGGKPVTVRDALTLINEVLDEAMAEQEGDFDADTRWALAWFEQIGFAEGAFGDADTLSKAKGTAVSGLAEAGILLSKGGKVRLLRPAELPADWNPATDPRLTVWEMVHHLIRVLESGGETAAARMVAAIGSKAEVARELAYRLYTLCERKKRAAEAMAYNGLVQSWPEILTLSRDIQPEPPPAQGTLL